MKNRSINSHLFPLMARADMSAMPGNKSAHTVHPSHSAPAEAATTQSAGEDSTPSHTAFTHTPADAGDYALRVSRAILDAAQDGIYGLDLKGFVTFVNPAARRMTGWSLDDLKGRTQHSMVHHSHADGSAYPQQDCPIYQALRDAQTYHRDDEVFWRKDGSSFPVSYTSTPVISDGRVTGAVVVFRDITNLVQERAWQQSKGRVLQSVRHMRPMRETLSHIREALGVLMAADHQMYHPPA